MTKDEIIEKLLVSIEGTANMMRGMLFDVGIPPAMKEELREKIKHLDEITDTYSE